MKSSNAESAKADTQILWQHTWTLLNRSQQNKTPALGNLMAVLDLQRQPHGLVKNGEGDRAKVRERPTSSLLLGKEKYQVYF